MSKIPHAGPTSAPVRATSPTGPAGADPFASGAVRAALERHFGFSDLRPGQADALRPVLERRDALVVMPTGAGKSLIYQLGALMQPRGVTVVVSPLIALMKDQVDALRARGVAAAFVNSSQSQAEQREALDDLRAGRLTLVYVAPERLRVASFQRALREAEVALLAVDEAHCVSQWGHDFRPDYLAVGAAREAIGGADGPPPCVALTATATPRVQGDIAAQLGLRDPAHLVTGFNRPNLRFEVATTPGVAEKRQALRAFLDARPGQAGLVYVSTRKDADALAQFIRETGRDCDAYHAGLPDRERADVQDRFLDGRLGLVVATNAFGMGVDRGDVRFVAHWAIPPNLEAYYQEAGRAGRDGQPAVAVLFYAPQDRQLREWLIEQNAPTGPELRAAFRYVSAARRAADEAPRPGGEDGSDATFELGLGERGGVHPSKVRLVLALLVRAGALAEEPGGAGALRWTPGRWDDRAIARVLESSAKHADGKGADLEGIVRYAQSDTCRRRAILDHFGDPAETGVPADACCDVCTSRARLRAAPDEIPAWDALPMASRVALGLLDAVRRTRWPVGRLTLSKILAGSQAKGMDRHARHPYYGRLGHVGQAEVDRLYKQLMVDGYLRIGGGEYPVVELTPLGVQALDHREAITLAGAESSARRASRPATRAGSAPEAALGPAAEARFERLRAWRTEQAREREVPPYVVFSDKTLRALADALPETDADLLAVPGIGPAKAEAYGADVLRLLAEV